jgi:amino acid permease
LSKRTIIFNNLYFFVVLTAQEFKNLFQDTNSSADIKMETNNNHTNESETADPVAVTNDQHVPTMLTDVIAASSDDDNVDYDPHNDSRRRGTIFSARFNIWSTMVGGGSLSLPLAFAKTGNALVGPLILLLTAVLTEFCWNVLLDAADMSTPSTTARSETTIPRSSDNGDESNQPSSQHQERRPCRLPRGSNSLESISAAAFGSTAYSLSTLLVYFMCFFGIVGYAVLLRDMLQPVTDAWSSFHNHQHYSNDTFDELLWEESYLVTGSGNGTAPISTISNAAMWIVVLIVTPLCTLPTLTSLQHVGAASMSAVVILGGCIVYRSIQCTMGRLPPVPPPTGIDPLLDNFSSLPQDSHAHWTSGFRLFPESAHDVLNVIPLFISCYVCHYNIPVVHNDLQHPSRSRVRWWLRSTVWGATAFYLTMGLAGSVYATACAETVHGNILLDFPSTDPLLLTGRLCLAVTIALAFPVLTLPARDILLRIFSTRADWFTRPSVWSNGGSSTEATIVSLTEPLLSDNPSEETTAPTANREGVEETCVPSQLGRDPVNDEEQRLGTDPALPEALLSTPSLAMRLLTSVAVLWTGTAVASCVSSIDIVWDLLGSSLSILLSFLIPSGCYLAMSRQASAAAGQSSTNTASSTSSTKDSITIWTCWLLILVFTPLMFISTANAIYNMLHQE